MTFDGIGGIRRRSSSDRLVSDPLIGRVDGKRRQEPVWFGTKLKRMFLKSIGVRSESKAPKTMPNNFLAELWNRGSRYSSVATLRALIHLAESKTELDYSALDKESAFRLRKNLLDHGELPHAIAAVRKNVETWNSSERKTKVLEFLDGLLRTLKENFHELSSRTGQSGTKGRKPDTQEQDRLHSILAAAAYKSVCDHAGKRVRSPAELAQTELTKLDAKPAPKSAPPAESVPPAPQTYDYPKIRQTFERWGVIEPEFLKLLLRGASEILESNGIRGTGEDIDRYLDSFEKADSATRNLFLVALTETLQSKDHLGIERALRGLDEVATPLGRAMDVKTFTTSNRPDGDGEPTSQYLRARYLIHDIARGLSDVKAQDLARAVGAALVKSEVTKEEAAAFMKYAGALQLGGRSKIVRDTIAEYAEKIDGYGAVKRRFQLTGLVDPEVAENLTRDAFQRQGKAITEEKLQEFVADFTSAATGRRDYVLNRLLDARDKEVGLDRLMQIVKGTRLWTFTDLPAISNGDLATYAIHDIARSFTPTLQGEDFKRAVSDALLRSSLTSEQAAAFMQHAKDLPLAGRSVIVREVIAERAEGKL
jgi:hypothetical protein